MAHYSRSPLLLSGVATVLLLAVPALGARASGPSLTQGSGWAILKTQAVGSQSQLDATDALSPSDVWAVGSSVVAGGPTGDTTQTLAEQWDGSKWTVSATPRAFGVSDFLAVTASSTTLFAVGDAQLTQASRLEPLGEAHAA